MLGIQLGQNVELTFLINWPRSEGLQASDECNVRAKLKWRGTQKMGKSTLRERSWARQPRWADSLNEGLGVWNLLGSCRQICLVGASGLEADFTLENQCWAGQCWVCILEKITLATGWKADWRGNEGSKDAGTPRFTAALFTIAKTWKQPKCPSIEEWIKKMWYIYTLEYYSAIEKNEIMPFAATWMDLEIIILSEVSQTEKDKYRMISLICGI